MRWECTKWKKSQYLHLSVTHAAVNIPKYSFRIQQVWIFLSTLKLCRISVFVILLYSYPRPIWVESGWLSFAGVSALAFLLAENNIVPTNENQAGADASCLRCAHVLTVLTQPVFGTIKVSLLLFILTFELWLWLAKWRKMLWKYRDFILTM